MNIRRKLSDNSGASVILALVFLLICIGIGGMILTSATVNARKNTGSAAEQQDYFAVSSAARLIRDAWGGSSVTYDESYTDYTCGYPNHSDTTDHSSKNSDTKLSAAAYDVFMKNAEFVPMGSGFAADTFTVEADTAHSAAVGDVDVTFRMDNAYNATFTLRPSGSDSYGMTLKFKAVVTKDTAYSSSTCTHSESGTDENGESVSYDVSYDITTTTNTTTVTWDAGEIYKGAA